MEGPSLVIARDEMLPAIGKKVILVKGNSRLPIQTLKNQKLLEIGTWGKHLLFFFSNCTVKIHFLLWGSYRVDHPKENYTPRLMLKFPNLKIFCYSCSIRFLEEDVEDLYDWSADIMSPSWSEKNALKKLLQASEEMVCDVLLDQAIFSGVGNIIKNEVLFALRLHPKQPVGKLSRNKLLRLIRETHSYTWKFYEWKKNYELKKHWQIMRKKTCPRCGGKVTREPTGRRQRLSHYCPRCQKLF